MAPIERPPNWVGREGELAILRAGVDAVRRGEGALVWVEGEAGIGKSSLVAEALATADPGWEIGWGIADRLTERLPLRVMLDCLGVRPGSPDPRRAKAAELLRSERLGLSSAGDVSAIGVEVLVTLVDELCAAAPAVIVIDDVQWADDGVADRLASARRVDHPAEVAADRDVPAVSAPGGGPGGARRGCPPRRSDDQARAAA